MSGKEMTLAELGERLKYTDMLIMALAARRMGLAELVGEVKLRDKQAIFRSEIEDSRINEMRAKAVGFGLNPHFAESLMYLLIGEACKRQMVQLQSEVIAPPTSTPEEHYAWLKKNLLELAARWAPEYDRSYEQGFFATQSCLAIENEIMWEDILLLPEQKTLLDLGCATGRLTIPLSRKFESGIGYDISGDMTDEAMKKLSGPEAERITFATCDLEGGIPRPDRSVSYVVMNLGTASDMKEISFVIKEAMRVLEPGGRFFFSFYNRDALLYNWEILPWPVGLAAQINLRKDCLDVHYGSRLFQVYARAFTVTEVEAMFKRTGAKPKIVTFPTFSSVMPNDLFEGQPLIQQAVGRMDRALKNSGLGAYIVATGVKKY